MAYLTHFYNFNTYDNSYTQKIPEYAKDFKREYIYILGINKRCGEFMRILGDKTDSFEEVFWSSRAKALIRHFKDFLEAQKMGKLQNISELKFKLSAVIKIIHLRNDLYFHMGNTFYADFFEDDEFQDFFENFIIFTNNLKIKNKEDFEDDLFAITSFIEDMEDNDSESERERLRVLFEQAFESDSDSDFEGISESDSDSDSD